MIVLVKDVVALRKINTKVLIMEHPDYYFYNRVLIRSLL